MPALEDDDDLDLADLEELAFLTTPDEPASVIGELTVQGSCLANSA